MRENGRKIERERKKEGEREGERSEKEMHARVKSIIIKI